MNDVRTNVLKVTRPSLPPQENMMKKTLSFKRLRVTDRYSKGAAAYATTRKDSAGEVARSTGTAAASTATAVKKFNDEHDITGKLWKAGEAAAEKAKEVNQKYGITTKVASAATTGYQAAAEFEKKNKVTAKVGTALSSGLDRFTKMVGGGGKSGGAEAKDLPSVPN